MAEDRKNASIKDIQNALFDLAKSQQKTQEAQQRTEEARRRGEERLEKLFARLEKAQQRTEKYIEKVSDSYGGLSKVWGNMVENLIAGGLLKLLKKWKIKVERVQPRFKFFDGEFDLVAINGEEMVIIEVKSTLTKKKIDDFLEQLEKYKQNPPKEYRGKIIYAGVGFLDARKGAIEHGKEKGLFVIQGLGGENAVSTIVNSEGFRPRKI